MKSVSYNNILVLNIVFALSLAFYQNVCAYDPDPLQDFCVATKHPEKKGLYVNGKFCKDLKNVTADDFYYPRIDVPTERSKLWGIKGTFVDVQSLPGLNTLGISIAYADHEPKGIVPPHIHPRASEIIVVLKGYLRVGFVTSNLDGNRLFEKILKKGDVYVFPIGLVHIIQNIGNARAVSLHAYGSQNPGNVLVPAALFGSKPPIDTKILTKSFQVNDKVVEYLKSINWDL